MQKVIRSAAIAAISLATLTACDPPIPESILVAQAERQVQCGDPGEVSLFLDAGYADLGFTWQEMLASSCPDLTLTLVEDAASADLIGTSIKPECPAIASGPLGFDGAALVFYLDEAFALNLNGEAIQGIFSGALTNWSDPLFAELNPEIEFPDLEIAVMESSSQPTIDAMQAWAARLTGQDVSFDLLVNDSEAYFMDLVFELEPGGVALVPMSAALASGATLANVLTEDGSIAAADEQSLYAGSTMFRLQDSADQADVVAVFDAELEPQPFPGTGEAATPYEAMYPIKLYLCGEESLSLRAVARYLVRLDAQGVIATSTVQALSEAVRVESAVVLGKGLPLPDVEELAELDQ